MEGCDSLADEVVGAVIRRAARFLFFSILRRNHNGISTKGVVDQSFVKMVKMEKNFFSGATLVQMMIQFGPWQKNTQGLFLLPFNQRMVGKLLVLQ